MLSRFLFVTRALLSDSFILCKKCCGKFGQSGNAEWERSYLERVKVSVFKERWPAIRDWIVHKSMLSSIYTATIPDKICTDGELHSDIVLQVEPVVTICTECNVECATFGLYAGARRWCGECAKGHELSQFIPPHKDTEIGAIAIARYSESTMEIFFVSTHNNGNVHSGSACFGSIIQKGVAMGMEFFYLISVLDPLAHKFYKKFGARPLAFTGKYKTNFNTLSKLESKVEFLNCEIMQFKNRADDTTMDTEIAQQIKVRQDTIDALPESTERQWTVWLEGVNKKLRELTTELSTPAQLTQSVASYQHDNCVHVFYYTLEDHYKAKEQSLIAKNKTGSGMAVCKTVSSPPLACTHISLVVSLC